MYLHPLATQKWVSTASSMARVASALNSGSVARVCAHVGQEGDDGG